MTEKKTRKQGAGSLRAIAAAGCFFLFLLCPHNFLAPRFENPSPLAGPFMTEALDPDDEQWDVRDSKNQPVRTPAKKREIRILFASAVVDLLVIRDLPAVSAAKEILEALAKPVRRRLTRAHGQFRSMVELAVLFIPKRALEKIALALAGFLISMAPALIFIRFHSSLPPALQRTPQTVPIRC